MRDFLRKQWGTLSWLSGLCGGAWFMALWDMQSLQERNRDYYAHGMPTWPLLVGFVLFGLMGFVGGMEDNDSF